MLPESQFLPKLCEKSNGVDLPLQKDLYINPGEILTVGLRVRFQIPDGHCGLLMNRSSALPKHNIRVTLGLIDKDYRDEIKVVLENVSDSLLTLKAGTAICQFLLLPSKSPKLLSNHVTDQNSRGSFGSTGHNFLPTRILNRTPKKIILKQTQAEKSKNNINLMELADKANISATAFMLSTGSQSTSNKNKTFQCFEINSHLREGLERKIYFPIFINNFRVIACVDSGSDVTLMQESLYHLVFNKRKLSESKILTIKSFSNNDIRVLGEINSYVKFTSTGKTISLCILVIKDIGDSIPYFLYGNDSLKTTLSTLAYSGDTQDPTPELVINSPEKIITTIYYCSPEEIL